VGARKAAYAKIGENSLSPVTQSFLDAMKHSTSEYYPQCIENWLERHRTVESIDKIIGHVQLKSPASTTSSSSLDDKGATSSSSLDDKGPLFFVLRYNKKNGAKIRAKNFEELLGTGGKRLNIKAIKIREVDTIAEVTVFEDIPKSPTQVYLTTEEDEEILSKE